MRSQPTTPHVTDEFAPPTGMRTSWSATQHSTGSGPLPIRIYALAKQLNLDSKVLVDICTKAGVTGKGSALASLTDEELAKVTAFLGRRQERCWSRAFSRVGGPLGRGLARGAAPAAFPPGGLHCPRQASSPARFPCFPAKPLEKAPPAKKPAEPPPIISQGAGGEAARTSS